MESMRFQVVFTYDPEYVGYVAEVPELPGCLSQGKTIEEATDNIREAISGFLAVLDRSGHPFVPSRRPSFVGEVAV